MQTPNHTFADIQALVDEAAARANLSPAQKADLERFIAIPWHGTNQAYARAKRAADLMITDGFDGFIFIVKARPTIVCLCGSTRFSRHFQEANLRETLAGRVVLTIGCDMKSDDQLFASMSADERARVKDRLDRLHLDKIDLADEVLILNVEGYMGESTRREYAYALEGHKRVRWLWTPEVNQRVIIPANAWISGDNREVDEFQRIGDVGTVLRLEDDAPHYRVIVEWDSAPGIPYPMEIAELAPAPKTMQ